MSIFDVSFKGAYFSEALILCRFNIVGDGLNGGRHMVFGPLGLWGGLWAVSKVESSEDASSFPRFILLGSFSDTLLVVSILDILLFLGSFAVLKGFSNIES